MPVNLMVYGNEPQLSSLLLDMAGVLAPQESLLFSSGPIQLDQGYCITLEARDAGDSIGIDVTWSPVPPRPMVRQLLRTDAYVKAAEAFGRMLEQARRAG